MPPKISLAHVEAKNSEIARTSSRPFLCGAWVRADNRFKVPETTEPLAKKLYDLDLNLDLDLPLSLCSLVLV